MQRRYVSIWFRHLVTDWLIRKHPELETKPFAVVSTERGRITVVGVNHDAEECGVYRGMALADARALQPDLETFDYKPDFEQRLLDLMADWLVRYTPSVCVHVPDGIMLDVTGCAHLLGGEFPFLKDLVTRLRSVGYDARAAMADTQGAAWAIARYGQDKPLIMVGGQRQALAPLPPAALRLDQGTTEKLTKLGIKRIADIYKLPRPNLRKRFGGGLLMRLDQALGDIEELINPKKSIEAYEVRMSFPEGIASRDGISAVLEDLLDQLCQRLEREQKGIRAASFRGYRLDGALEEISIGTGLPSRKPGHLFKLFENKIETIEPALGIELFVLSATQIDDFAATQEGLLEGRGGMNSDEVAELVDRLAGRMGKDKIKRFLPRERHWPKRSIETTDDLTKKPNTAWQIDKPRPIRMLRRPEPIEVMSAVPDYPPLQFRHKGKLHRVKKADRAERIEREWWEERGPSRDYYQIEDEDGCRYWVFRSGHHKNDEPSRWFLHGFFA